MVYVFAFTDTRLPYFCGLLFNFGVKMEDHVSISHATAFVIQFLINSLMIQCAREFLFNTMCAIILLDCQLFV